MGGGGDSSPPVPPSVWSPEVEQQKLLTIKRHDLSFFDIRIRQRAFHCEKKSSQVIIAM